MFQSFGQLIVENNKTFVQIDSEISKYYISLIPFKINKQKYPPHISLIRNEIIPNANYLHSMNNSIINFEYDSYIFNNETYYWLNVYSNELKQIRINCGLCPTKIGVTFSPDEKCAFHITLGNTK